MNPIGVLVVWQEHEEEEKAEHDERMMRSRVMGDYRHQSVL